MIEPVVDACYALTVTAREVDPAHLRAYAARLFEHAAETMDAAVDETTGMYWSAVLTARLAGLLEAVAEDVES